MQHFARAHEEIKDQKKEEFKKSMFTIPKLKDLKDPGRQKKSQIQSKAETTVQQLRIAKLEIQRRHKAQKNKVRKI